jgi:hypothetical protein
MEEVPMVNGWFKRYNSTIISTGIVIITLIISISVLASQMQSDIANLEKADVRHEGQLEYQDKLYDDVNFKLGKISGQLETLIKLNKGGE